MKTQQYKSRGIKIIQIITVLFGMQINFFSSAILADNHPANKLLPCVTCSNISSATQSETLSQDMSWLAPTTPAEAAFSDETANTEINLTATTPKETSSEGDSELINSSIIEFLAPVTPPEADFND